jgi:predicted Zn-dependent protease
MSTYTWIDSPAWQLQFFGLPGRVPWPAGAPEPDATGVQFDMAAFIGAVEACVAGEPGVIGPWRGFLAASRHFEAMTEALEDHEYSRASGLLKEIDREHPGSPYSLFHLAFVHRQSGDDREAIRLYGEAAQKAPGVPFIWNNLGTMLAEHGNREQAVNAFLNAVRLNQNDEVALESLVQLKAAVKLLRDQKDPKSVVYVPVDQFRKMATAQIEPLSKQPEQLVQFAETILRDAVIPDVGVKALEKAHELQPGNARTLVALGAGYRMIGEFEKSKEAVARYTEMQPDDPWGFFNLAQSCNAAGDAAGERAALERTLAIDPNIQQALGIFFELKGDHGPGKEKQLVDYADTHNAWMPLLLASSIARERNDIPSAVGYAARAYERNPASEEVLLQYCAMLGDAGDAGTLELVIHPAVTGGRYGKRLDWNYAQSLRQVGKTAQAIEALRRAQLSDAPADFKGAAETAIEFWTGLRTQSEEQLQVNAIGQLVRPVVLALDEGDGGILLNPRQALPVQQKFPWRARETGGTEARVRLQQGQGGLGQPPQSLGTFVVKNVMPAADGPANIECRIEATPEGKLLFSAGQDGRKLPVSWQSAS